MKLFCYILHVLGSTQRNTNVIHWLKIDCKALYMSRVQYHAHSTHTRELHLSFGQTRMKTGPHSGKQHIQTSVQMTWDFLSSDRKPEHFTVAENKTSRLFVLPLRADLTAHLTARTASAIQAGRVAQAA